MFDKLAEYPEFRALWMCQFLVYFITGPMLSSCALLNTLVGGLSFYITLQTHCLHNIADTLSALADFAASSGQRNVCADESKVTSEHITGMDEGCVVQGELR